MRISNRGRTSSSTYFITSSTYDKKQFFQNPHFAALLVEVIQQNRDAGRFILHAFVIMPDHFHALLTPAPDLTLERVMQFIKGWFSFRIKKDFGYAGEVWQTSFYDRRIREFSEFERFVTYIHMNPVRKGLAACPEEYEFTSVRYSTVMDSTPQRLKPTSVGML